MRSPLRLSSSLQAPASRIALAAAAVLTACTASGQSLYWGSGGTNNAWTNASFWYLDADETMVSPAVPTLANDVFFNTTPDNALGGASTVAADIAAQSLTFNTSGATVISQSGNRVLSLGSGGITVNAGAGNATLGVSTNTLSVQATDSQTWTNGSTSTLNVRSLRASNLATGPVQLTLNAASTGPITFSLGISDSPDTVNALSVVVDSAGTGGVNFVGSSYTGGTTIRRGLASTNGSLGIGDILLGVAAGTDDVRLNVTGIVNNNITVGTGSGLRALTGSGSGDIRGNVVLNRDLNIGSVATTGQTLAVSGVISGNANVTLGRIATGTSNPTVTLTGDNTYTGKTTIESATVVVDSLGNTGSISSLGAPTTVENATISLGAVSDSTLRYTGTGDSTDRVVEIASNRTVTLEQAGTGLLNYTGGVIQGGSGSRTLRLRGATEGTGEMSGEIANIVGGGNTNLAKLDSGTWRLSGINTYAGSTSIGISGTTGGVLEVVHLADGGQPSSIGASSASASNLSFGGVGTAATLRYVGAGGSTNRSFIIGGIGAIIDASGTGPISFTSLSNTAYGTGNVATTLTLTGTNTDANTYAANQGNNGTGAVGLTKEGTGTWDLSGTSMHSGPTTVNQGLLLVSGALSGNSTVTVNGGTLGGTGGILGPAIVNAGGSLLGGDGTTATEDLLLLSDVTFGDGSFIRLALGGAGSHSTLARGGGLWTFDSDQAFNFIDLGATATSYQDIITGLDSNPGVASWTIANPGYSGTFTFDGANVDLVLVAVPEPSALTALMGAASLLLGLRRRRA